jgi:hypothetical protein
LCLDERCRDFDDGLWREDQFALRDSPDVSVEGEGAQGVEERLIKQTQRPQVADRVFRESELLQVLEDRVQARGDEEAAPGRQRPDEQVERRGRVVPFPEITLRHGQFVEVGQQRHRVRGDEITHHPDRSPA